MWLQPYNINCLHASLDTIAWTYDPICVHCGAEYGAVHHQLISMKTLDRLQEALKKGQDILVQLRDNSIDPTTMPSPIYLGWYDEHDYNDEKSFRVSISSLLGHTDQAVRPESLTSVRNFVVVSSHRKPFLVKVAQSGLAPIASVIRVPLSSTLFG